MGVNWIGLFTIVRREVQRMRGCRSRSSSRPGFRRCCSFSFSAMCGRHDAHIGGHKYLEFVMPGVLMMNIINAAFLQSSSAIYFSRFIKFVEEMLVAPLSYAEMIVGSLSAWWCSRHRHRHRHSADGHWLRRHDTSNSWPLFLFWIVSVSAIFGLLGHHYRAVVQEFRAAQYAGGVLPDPAFHAGRRFITVEMLPRLAAMAGSGPIPSSISSMAFAAP